MNELLAKVTPHTRGIIWLSSGAPDSQSATYKGLDYLLNGLLTATLRTETEASSRVLMTTNFHFPLHVLLIEKFVPAEYESFLKLLKKDLGPESTVLVIDENDAFSELLSSTPKELKSLLHLFK